MHHFHPCSSSLHSSIFLSCLLLSSPVLPFLSSTLLISLFSLFSIYLHLSTLFFTTLYLNRAGSACHASLLYSSPSLHSHLFLSPLSLFIPLHPSLPSTLLVSLLTHFHHTTPLHSFLHHLIEHGLRVMRQFHRILVDQEDALSFKEGEEVTFLRWVRTNLPFLSCTYTILFCFCFVIVLDLSLLFEFFIFC